MPLMPLDNVNIVSHEVILTPEDIKERLPCPEPSAQLVVDSRQRLRDILDHRRPELFIVVGPCSIHDPEAALEYAQRLHALAAEVEPTLMLILRAYFEKPRTGIGWKGYINDPFLDDSFAVEEGLLRSRRLLLDLAELGLPVGTEALDPIVPQYLGDLVTWSSIGARTTESQTHRELASGLSTPVGFKNSTDGSLEVAVNAIRSAAHPHRFLGISQHGQCAVFHTRGNRYGHLVLRGGSEPNDDDETIARSERLLAKAGLKPSIVVDCSHGNSLKDPSRQPEAFTHCIDRVVQGRNQSVVGLMLESNLEGGRQDLTRDPSDLKYGVSITDACLDWITTEALIREAHRRLQDRPAA